MTLVFLSKTNPALPDLPRVRGTVRSLKNQDKVKHLYELCPNAKYKLELVEADLTKPESWQGWVCMMGIWSNLKVNSEKSWLTDRLIAASHPSSLWTKVADWPTYRCIASQFFVNKGGWLTDLSLHRIPVLCEQRWLTDRLIAASHPSSLWIKLTDWPTYRCIASQFFVNKGGWLTDLSLHRIPVLCEQRWLTDRLIAASHPSSLWIKLTDWPTYRCIASQFFVNKGGWLTDLSLHRIPVLCEQRWLTDRLIAASHPSSLWIKLTDWPTYRCIASQFFVNKGGWLTDLSLHRIPVLCEQRWLTDRLIAASHPSSLWIKLTDWPTYRCIASQFFVNKANWLTDLSLHRIPVLCG